MLGFVVEGFNDEIKLKELMPDAFYVVTKGTRLDNRVRMNINSAFNQCHEVYLITDPDEAGEILAEKLLKEFPTLKRILLDAKECECYRNHRLKIGLEHASIDYLEQVFRNNNVF